MWEGQATTKLIQRLAGAALAIASLPFASLGAWGLCLGFVRTNTTFEIVAFTAVALLVGIFGLTIAYRVFFGRGVRQGGGVMSPIAFRIGGFIFIAFAGLISYDIFVNGKSGDFGGLFSTLFVALLFFGAARHRGAMRSIK
jgi:hypothetical protein